MVLNIIYRPYTTKILIEYISFINFFILWMRVENIMFSKYHTKSLLIDMLVVFNIAI
jgi:hypothetical protein